MVIAHRTSESNVNCAKNSITVTIRIQLPSGIQMVVTWPCRPFGYQIFLTTNKAFSVRYSDHHLNTRPFGNQTQIYHLKTKLVWYSDGYCTGIQMVEINLVQKSLIFISCLENRTKNHSKWHFRSGTQAMIWNPDKMSVFEGLNTVYLLSPIFWWFRIATQWFSQGNDINAR